VAGRSGPLWPPHPGLFADRASEVVAITTSTGHVASAMNRPEGRWASPADSSSAIDCSSHGVPAILLSSSKTSPPPSVTMAW
jgi:hypothetical protein